MTKAMISMVVFEEPVAGNLAGPLNGSGPREGKPRGTVVVGDTVVVGATVVVVVVVDVVVVVVVVVGGDAGMV